MSTWAAANGRDVGAIVSLPVLWDLARVWYVDRLSPGWERRPAEDAQRVFDDVGLRGPFWRLTPTDSCQG